MNLSPKLVPLLRNNGYECVYWQTVGASDAEDTEIVEWARREQYTIITNDLDFAAILGVTGQATPSVVLIRRKDLFTEMLFPHLVNALNTFERELLDGALIVVDEHRSRIRMLPLR